ncbi:MAG TPA: glycosyltransferase family 4 protein [Acidisoma sp.]|uniref:glycosyltransferase n=1 Tax=Acidisoma sp. TaxID=1872115 RepID=UPI002CD7C41E|nr:glycosyltransferase family 4 protein [Acidisoma sp.]HTH99861.1 glycosyltransferase family 4 protein [Acidisoma sp.]
MSPDALLPHASGGPAWREQPAPYQVGPWQGTADLREALLRCEVARLTAERNRLRDALSGQAARPWHPDPQDAAYLRHRIASKDALIRALHASTCWRLTAPFRVLAGLLRGARPPSADSAIAETDRPPSAALPLPGGLVGPGILRGRPEGQSLGEVLVVADHLPLFDQQSGGLRLKTLIGMISRLGWRVTFGSFLPEQGPGPLATEAGRQRYEAALVEIGVTGFAYGLEGIRHFLAAHGGRMRFAFVSFPGVASDVIPLVRSFCPWARVLYDTVDLHFLRMERQAAVKNSPLLHRQARAMRELELACLRSADVTLAISEPERQLLLDLVPEVVVETVPNVFASPGSPPAGVAGRQGVLFLGGFWHQPNADAVLWFADHILPLIRAEAPEVVFRIAGSNPTPEVLALGDRPGIEVLGHVPDLAPIFDAARVFVAPLRFGAGMKGKVGQAMMSGLPVVTTGIGAEGMAAEDGRHLLIAEEPQDFADRVVTLLREDAPWHGLQQEGRALIEATLSEAAVAERLARLFHV